LTAPQQQRVVLYRLARARFLCDEHAASRHDRVKSVFLQFWIKSEKLPRRLGSTFVHALEKRKDTEYGDLLVFAPGEVEVLIQHTEEFIHLVGEQVERLLSAMRAEEMPD